jgi:DMSO/TMAO reductase YedYZ molybdopterin-dependent catalytic subunit
MTSERKISIPSPVAAVSRRGLVGGGAAFVGLAGVTMLAKTQPPLVKVALDTVSRFNDAVQHQIYSMHRLAATYPPEAITSPFPFNAFYPESLAPAVDGETWRLKLEGDIADRRPLSLSDIRAMSHEVQTTRLICIEGWSAVGRWIGVPLAQLLKRVGADLSAKYVKFTCADEYWASIDMASALHAQTILATAFLDQPLPQEFGFPIRLRIPTKLGFKNAKHIVAIEVTNVFPGGYWEDQGYNWFAGL